uniref:Tubulin-specific chaperone D n=1 Tax=Globodera pallida TaxID=36090 RepID=A0A183C119_GLOPA
MMSSSCYDLDGTSQVIGCTPIRLEDGHLTELRSLIASLPNSIPNSSSEEKNLERFEKLVLLYSEEPQLLDPALASLVDNPLKFVEWHSPPTDGTGRKLSLLTSAALVEILLGELLLKVTDKDNVVRWTAAKGIARICARLPRQMGAEVVSSVLVNCFGESNADEAANAWHGGVWHWLNSVDEVPFAGSTLASLVDNLLKFVEWHSPPTDGTGRKLSLLTSAALVRLRTLSMVRGHKFLMRFLPHEFELFEPVLESLEYFAHLLGAASNATSSAVGFETESDGGVPLISQLKLLIAILKQGRRLELRPFAFDLLCALSPQFVRANCPNILIRDLIAKLLQRLALVLLRPRLAPWRYHCGHRSLEENLRGRRGQTEAVESDRKQCTEEEGDEEGEDESAVHYDQVEILLGELLLKVTDKDNVVRWTAAKGIARICARLPRQMGAEVVSSVLVNCFGESNADEAANAWHGGCLALAELCRRGCLLPDQVPKVVVGILPRALTFEQFHLGFTQAVNVRDAACYICWAFARAYEAELLRQLLSPLAGILLSVALFDREVNVRRAASAAFQENVGRNDSFPHGIAVLSMVDFVEVARIKHCYTELAVQVAAHFGCFVRPMLDHLCGLKSVHWDEMIFPVLCDRLRSADPVVKHGAFLGVSGLLLALNGKHDVLKYRDLFFSAVTDQCVSLGHHRSKGFSLIGKSLCRIIESLCAIGCDLTDEQLIQFHDILDIVISDSNKQMADYAAAAFPALMAFYKNGQPNLSLIIVSDDYTTTTNGDIGRFARLQAVHAIGQLLPLAFSSAPFPVSQCQLNKAIGKVVERACESIDDLREKACKILNELAKLDERHPLSAAIAERERLISIFTLATTTNHNRTTPTPTTTATHSPINSARSLCDGTSCPPPPPFSSVDWRHSQGFLRLAPLLDSPTYGRNALAGFVLSAGSVCSWTSRLCICVVYSAIVSRHGDASPVLFLFRTLLNDRQLQRIEAEPDKHSEFVALCELSIKLALGKGRPKVKTLAVSTLGSLLQLNKRSQIYRRVLFLLLSLLDSPYASLREQAAEQLFEFFSCEASEGGQEGEVGIEIGMALELLTGTDWSKGKGLADTKRQISDILLTE